MYILATLTFSLLKFNIQLMNLMTKLIYGLLVHRIKEGGVAGPNSIKKMARKKTPSSTTLPYGSTYYLHVHVHYTSGFLWLGHPPSICKLLFV